LASRLWIRIWRCQVLHWRQSRLLRSLRIRKHTRGSLPTLDLPFRFRIHFSYYSFRIPSRKDITQHLHHVLIPSNWIYISSSSCMDLGWWLVTTKRFPRLRWCDNYSFGRRMCRILWRSNIR